MSEPEQSAPFDTAAAGYDSEFETLPGTERLRRIIIGHAMSRFPSGGSILELNAGTGTDAVTLARAGYRVLATDGAPEMVRQALSKVRAAGLDSLIRCRHLRFDQLGSLRGERFDGVFSNLGGLNCTRELPDLARVLHEITTPGSSVVAVLLSPFCLWEALSFSVRGRPETAIRRRADGAAPVSRLGARINVFFHSPATLQQGFSPYFRKDSLIGLNVITPPPSHTKAYGRLAKVLPFLEATEDTIARLPLFRRIGDHFLYSMKRRDDV